MKLKHTWKGTAPNGNKVTTTVIVETRGMTRKWAKDHAQSVSMDVYDRMRRLFTANEMHYKP